MKTLIAFLLVVLSVSFFYGCSDDTVTPNTYTIQDVFPLKVGYKWKYQGHDSDEFFGSRDYTLAVSVDSSTTFQGQPAFVGSISVDSNFGSNGILYYSGPNLYSFDVTYNSGQLLVRYPMNINESVVISDTLYSDGNRQKDYIRYISGNTSIGVPAGTYGCLVYETLGLYGLDGTALDTTSKGKQYYSFGIGLIKQIDSSRSNTGSKWYQSSSIELISYSK